MVGMAVSELTETPDSQAPSPDHGRPFEAGP